MKKVITIPGPNIFGKDPVYYSPRGYFTIASQPNFFSVLRKKATPPVQGKK